MNKKQLTAIRRIVSNGKSAHPLSTQGYGGYFEKETGQVTFTDSYSLVVFNHQKVSEEDMAIFRSEDAYNWHDDMPVKAVVLFDPFTKNFHDNYCDEYSKKYAPKEINDIHKTMKGRKDEDDFWFKACEYGTCFDIRLMRNVVEAMGDKDFSVYFPKVAGKPIVVCGFDNMGLVMPLR